MKSAEPSVGLGYHWLILKRHWFPASVVFIIVFAGVLLATLARKPVYLAEGMLRFERESPTSSLTGFGKEIGSLEPLAERNNPITTETEIIRSALVTQTTIDKLNLRDRQGKPLKPKQFLKRLTIKEIEGTELLKVAYREAEPQKAAAVVNTLMAVYLEANIRANRSQAAAARKFIENQLPTAEATVHQAEVDLRHFREANNIVALKEEANSTIGIISGLQKQIVDAQSQIADTNSQFGVFQNRLGMHPQQAMMMTALSQTAGVQEILKQIQQIESDLAIERSRLNDTHPKIVSLETKLTHLKGVLQARITQVLGNPAPVSSGNLQMGALQQELTGEVIKLEGRRQGLASQVMALAAAQTAYQQRARMLPRLEQEQRELERKLEGSQSTYSSLLQKLQEIRVAENQNVGNASIVTAAPIPETPAASRSIAVAIAGLLGILGFGTTAYILEARDKSIKTVEEAKHLLGFTVLGVIPYAGKLKQRRREQDLTQLIPEIVVRDMPRSAASAAYRMLQANLKFLSSDKVPKTIVITSSVPREGKSTVSTNLAVAISQLGRNVLLIDADMHCPVQHQIWQLSNEVGLSNLIVEQAEPNVSIKQVMPNLDILPSGIIPPNPIALLDSQRMASLVEQFSNQYDFVIIDAPALNVVADALTLGKIVDGLLFVVRPGWVDYGSATFAKGLLEQSGQNVLGQVVNGVIPKNEPHSSYYFLNGHYTQDGAANVSADELVRSR
jgi:polysaccharide biosynthesis transport protein